MPLCRGCVGSVFRKSADAQPDKFPQRVGGIGRGWSCHVGQSLRAHAAPFESVVPRADGYGARILALPLVQAADADKTWKEFWNSTATLREIVEFGDPDETTSGGWQGRRDASSLLILQFSIGLMVLDHLISPAGPIGYDRRSAIKGLLPVLDGAVREMLAIDQLGGKFWSEAVRHLAIRRATWLSGRPGLQNNGDSPPLGPEARPTLADFIGNLGGTQRTY